MTDRDALRGRLAEILVEFAETTYEAEESIRIAPPPALVDRAVEAILDAIDADQP